MIIIFKDTDLQKLMETGISKKYKIIAKDERLVQQLVETYNTIG